MADEQGSQAIPAACAATDQAGEFRGPGGHELCAATSAAADADEVNRKRHQLQFELTTDIAYHAIREQFFARLNRFLTGLQVLLGTSAVAAMLSWYPGSAVWLIAISALAGVMLLIIDPAGSARDHRALRSRLHNIRAALEEQGGSNESLASARAQRIRVTADAPPGYRGIQAIAFNNAINATYDESLAKRYRYRVGWRGMIANWWPMRGHQFNLEQAEPPPS